MIQERMPQLDGLRAIAVGLVVVHHWTRVGPELDLGNIGVQLFFVLSGFLITGILLDLRVDLEAGNRGLKSILATFWQSRAARIWPVCFITLLVVYLCGDRFANREDLWWHWLFLSNFFFFLRGQFTSSLAHFWTLAVEQQFYLAWPFVILLLRRSMLERAIVAAIVIAPLTRVALYLAGHHEFAVYNLLPFANFDSLGIGALVALWSRSPAPLKQSRLKTLRGLALIAMVCFVATLPLGTLAGNPRQTLYSILFAWIVSVGAVGAPGLFGRALRSPLLVGLGTISYGIYVYHVFAPRTVGAGLRFLGAPAELHTGAALFFLCACLTITVASISWLVLERPINRARRRWQERRLRAAFAKDAGAMPVARG